MPWHIKNLIQKDPQVKLREMTCTIQHITYKGVCSTQYHRIPMHSIWYMMGCSTMSCSTCQVWLQVLLSRSSLGPWYQISWLQWSVTCNMHSHAQLNFVLPFFGLPKTLGTSDQADKLFQDSQWGAFCLDSFCSLSFTVTVLPAGLARSQASSKPFS